MTKYRRRKPENCKTAVVQSRLNAGRSTEEKPFAVQLCSVSVFAFSANSSLSYYYSNTPATQTHYVYLR